MKQKILKVGLLAIATALTIVALFAPQKVVADTPTNVISSQTERSLGDFIFRSVTLQPNPIQSPTNTFKSIDSTGTNFLMVSPTNNQFIIRQFGTNSFSVLTTNIVVTNNAAQTHTIIVVNGLIVGYQ